MCRVTLGKSISHWNKIGASDIVRQRSEKLRNCFSTIFSKFKRGVTPGKKIESEFSSYSAHLHIMFFLTRKFYELLLGGFKGVAQEKYRTDEQTD